MQDRSNQTVLSLLFGFLVCFAARSVVNADGRVFVLKLENSTGLLGFREAERACASLHARLASPAELRHAVVECFFSLCTRGWLYGGTVGTTVCDGVGSALKAVAVKTENATEDVAHLDAFCIRDKGVPCGDPPSFPSARLQGHSGYEMGDELLYTCVPGYVMPSGHRAFSLLCDSCGEWYGLVEICVKDDTEGHIDYEDKFTDSYEAAERHNQRPEEAHGEVYEEGHGTAYENGTISQEHQDTSASVEEGHQHQQREHEVEREVNIDEGEEGAVGDFTGHPAWEQEAPKGGTTDVAAATEAPVSVLSQKHMFWFPSEAFQEEGHSVSPNPVTQITERPPGIQSEESKENGSQEMHHHQNPIDSDDHEHGSDHYDDHEADDVDDHDDNHHDDHDDTTEGDEEGHDDHLKHYIHTQRDDLDRWDHHRNQDDHDNHYDMGEHEDDRGYIHYGNRGNDDQDDPYDEEESYENHEDVTEDQDDNDQEHIDGAKEPPDHDDHVDSEEHYGHAEDDNDHDDRDNHEDRENHDDRDDHNNHNDHNDDNDDRDEHDDREDYNDHDEHDDHGDHDDHRDHNDHDDKHNHDDHDDDSYPDIHDGLDDLHDHEHKDHDNYEDNDSHEDIKDGQHVILSIARDDEQKAPTDETWLDGYPVVATEIENGNSEMERPEAGEKETAKLPDKVSEAEILSETEAPKSPTREPVSKLGGVQEMWPGLIPTTATSSESDTLDSHRAAPTHLTKQPFIQQNPLPPVHPGDIVTEEHSMPNLPGESGERTEMEGEMGEAICTGENCPPPTPSNQGPKVAVSIVVACLIAIAVMVGVWCYQRQQQKSSVYEMNGKRQSQSRNSQQIEMQQKV